MAQHDLALAGRARRDQEDMRTDAKDKHEHPRPAMARVAQRHKWQGDGEPGHVRAIVVASNRTSSGTEVQREARM